MGKHSTSERFRPAVFLLVRALPGGLGFFSFQTSEGGQGQFTGHKVDQLVTRHMNPGWGISPDHLGQLGAIPTVSKLRTSTEHILISYEKRFRDVTVWISIEISCRSSSNNNLTPKIYCMVLEFKWQRALQRWCIAVALFLMHSFSSLKQKSVQNIVMLVLLSVWQILTSLSSAGPLVQSAGL